MNVALTALLGVLLALCGILSLFLWRSLHMLFKIYSTLEESNLAIRKFMGSVERAFRDLKSGPIEKPPHPSLDKSEESHRN